MAKGNKGFGASLTAGLEEDGSFDDAAPADGVLASRSDTLARLASGKVVTDRTEFVDPARCRPWRLHNRDLDHLNEETCRDLIDAFLSAKKQRIPQSFAASAANRTSITRSLPAFGAGGPCRG